jgi:hypothetical protein
MFRVFLTSESFSDYAISALKKTLNYVRLTKICYTLTYQARRGEPLAYGQSCLFFIRQAGRATRVSPIVFIVLFNVRFSLIVRSINSVSYHCVYKRNTLIMADEKLLFTRARDGANSDDMTENL